MNRPAFAPNNTATFTAHESAVRSYCRRMPQVFARARNALVWDEAGTEFIDFFSACGALNYGHNNAVIKQAAMQHLLSDSVLCGLDLHTPAKRDFIEDFTRIILGPRGLDYRLQFPGPTGTNAVEAALKLARKVTGRRTVVAFSKAFHGMSLGALAATENRMARKGAGVPLPHVVRLAYDGDDQCGLPGLDQFEATVRSETEAPAAFIVEPVQGEGGLNVASAYWLQRLAALAKRLGSVLIVDDIQAGCGRTGPFFSFEQAGIVPDIVCLAKSISGLGLPMALVLINPALDCWTPGEHNGTFRGNTLAFATASAALGYWDQDAFHDRKRDNEQVIRAWLDLTCRIYGAYGVTPCGRGLMVGLRFDKSDQAGEVARAVFDRNMLIETAGPHDEVLKLMPPLTIEAETLIDGLSRITDAISSVLTSATTIERAAA